MVVAGCSFAARGLGATADRPAHRVRHSVSNLRRTCGPRRPLRRDSWLDPAPTGQGRVCSGEPAAPTWGRTGPEAKRRSPGPFVEGCPGLGCSGERRRVLLRAPALCDSPGASVRAPGRSRPCRPPHPRRVLAVAAPSPAAPRVPSSPERGPAGFHSRRLGKGHYKQSLLFRPRGLCRRLIRGQHFVRGTRLQGTRGPGQVTTARSPQGLLPANALTCRCLVGGSPGRTRRDAAGTWQPQSCLAAERARARSGPCAGPPLDGVTRCFWVCCQDH